MRRPVASWGRRRRPSGLGVPVGLAVLLAALFGGFAWWWFGFRARDAAPEGMASPVGAARPATERPTSPVPPEPLDLPPLVESDGVVQDLAGVLSRHPQWAAWLVTDGLAERFVSAVASVAGGVSPGQHVPFLAPEGDFQVRETGDQVVVDPASYRRYDAVTEPFVSFETGAAVRLYQQLLPLFEEAHRTLGFPEGTFGDTFAAALERLLSVRVPEDPPGRGVGHHDLPLDGP